MNSIKWHISGTLRRQLIVLVALSLLFIFLISICYKDGAVTGANFYEFYQKNLRGYLFSGFISVGSFLLSLHTFVIINLKDKLFSTDAYKDKFARASGIEKNKIDEKDLFKPLDRLSCFLNLSIWLSIITAISQFTLGLANHTLLSIICIWLAVLTLTFMLNSLILIRENIKIMLMQNK
ncbi:hypothetical protein [Yersinia ruckeri]|uniref:hypothetical protein n=1 Tax=Yersinia ruckeri TaxID=29486 RepID=UPI0022389D82|nr:hypothetical protein [Yersinia ruckeri]MCW6601750.1 hypothetical protein [Yersinia ruckeri]MCW6606865.1 hypothetical protein [Yersinia ruckeri]MCW6615875.1 hypothetical protein [Yersinia ruckeri]